MSRALCTFSLAVAALAFLATFAVLGLVLAGRLTVGTVSDAFEVLTGFKEACTRAEKTELERLREEARARAEHPGAREFSEALREEIGRTKRMRLSAELLDAQAAALRAEIDRERTESLDEIGRERKRLAALKEELEDELIARASDATKSLARLYQRMDRHTVAEEIAERWKEGEREEIAAVLRAMGEHAASSVLEGVVDASLRAEIVWTVWGAVK